MINKKEKGFTLVELLAVIVILAIVLVIAVPKVMSVIEDSKKATLESTAKMIASAAENMYLSNALLGIDEIITCGDVVKLNDVDYQNCTISFDEDGTAKVNIEGKGKFEGMSVCNATKVEGNASDSCSTNNKCFKIQRVIKSLDVVDKAACESSSGIGGYYGGFAETLCNGGSVDGITLVDDLNYGVYDLSRLESIGAVGNVEYYDEIIIKDFYTIEECGTEVIIPSKIPFPLEYEVDEDKCVEAFGNLIGTENATTLCTGGTVDGVTLEYYIKYANGELLELGIIKVKKYETYPVVGIGSGSFQSRNLTKVAIPNSITNIGRSAFSDNQLQMIEIPSSVININAFALDYNEKLTTVINRTGRKFDWGQIMGNMCNQTCESFETDYGTIEMYYGTIINIRK